MGTEFCVRIVSKNAVNFEFCASTFFEEIEVGTSGTSCQADFDSGMGAKFCTRFVLKSTVDFLSPQNPAISGQFYIFG